MVGGNGVIKAVQRIGRHGGHASPSRSGRSPRWGLALLGVSLVVLASSCGSRLSERTIADASHRPIIQARTLHPSSGAQPAGAPGGSATAGPSTASSGAAPTPASAASASGTTARSAAAGTATGRSTAGSTAKSVVNLGSVGTYSGVIGAVFANARQSLDVWQAYTNAHGGLNGHPVHLSIEDDGGDPSTSASEVEQEVTQDHVIAFVGNLMPLTVNASVPYLQQQHIPVIGGDSTTPEWWQSPMLFPQASYVGGGDEDKITLQTVVAKGLTKMGLLYCVEDPECTTAYQELIQKGYAQQDGVTPAYSSSFSITQPDFTAQCLDAKQAGATFIYFAGDSASLLRMANNCAAQSYDPLYVAESLGVNATLQSNPHLEGLISAQSNFPWMDAFTPSQALYQQAMKTYAPGVQGSSATAAEWASGMLAVAAAGDLGPTPTSAQFLQGLWGIKQNDLGGLAPPLSFNPNGPATPSPCYFMMTLHNGQFVDLNNGATRCVQ